MRLTPFELTPLKRARRDKLLDVAERLFIAQGHRATTIEGLAEAAGLSKVTVYGYFPDRDAVFAAVAERLAERLRAAVLARLAAPGSRAERVGGPLIAKHAMVFDLLRGSAFAAELMAQKAAVGRIFTALDRDLVAAIAAVLGEEPLARLLFHAAMGIAEGAEGKPEMEADIRRLVGALLVDGAA